MAYDLNALQEAFKKEPPMCACGESRVCRAENMPDNPNPRCPICRLMAYENPDATPAEVTVLGRARWQRAAARGEESRRQKAATK